MAFLLDKPPIGIIPRWLAVEKRITDIREAINQYIVINKKIPIEWVEEYNELVTWIQNNKPDWKS